MKRRLALISNSCLKRSEVFTHLQFNRPNQTAPPCMENIFWNWSLDSFYTDWDRASLTHRLLLDLQISTMELCYDYNKYFITELHTKGLGGPNTALLTSCYQTLSVLKIAIRFIAVNQPRLFSTLHSLLSIRVYVARRNIRPVTNWEIFSCYCPPL